MMQTKLPQQRWQIAPEQLAAAIALAEEVNLSPLMAQTLINRGITTPEQAAIFLDPEVQQLPAPKQEFTDLTASVELLVTAIADGEKIAICGDYDADGMTSTALLMRALRHLGADVDYAIPSRMKDGYGINLRLVNEFAATGVGLILTVDNGITAFEPIQRAVELGLSVIITDHHDLPEKLPPADAVLNPKLLAETSPYYGLAGVGVAYILAIATAQRLERLQGLTEPLLELFTLGTIADLAPLRGVNRRWLKRGLRRLPQSQLAGVQALMQVAGVSDEQKELKPDDIGFRLGPRINAVGRLADPQIVIELLTTDDEGLALERAMQCEQINRQRQEMCAQIEQEAIAEVESRPIPWQQDRVLVVVQAGWHHGVIGIVASRLVERYGVPVFIGTYEEADPTQMRGSARGIEEFNVFEALCYCDDLLGKYGGHRAAGGFSLSTQNLALFQRRLSQFAHRCLALEHLKPLIKVDVQADFKQLDLELYQQIDGLQPWGIGNEFPMFWTPNVRVVEQRLIGKHHLKLTLASDAAPGQQFKAIAWRWGEYFPLPTPIDVAYKLRENAWNGYVNLEFELVGVRWLTSGVDTKTERLTATKKAVFEYGGKSYWCSFWQPMNELRIKNQQGKVLAVGHKQSTGLLGTSRESAQVIDTTKPPYCELIKMAWSALEEGVALR